MGIFIGLMPSSRKRSVTSVKHANSSPQPAIQEQPISWEDRQQVLQGMMNQQLGQYVMTWDKFDWSKEGFDHKNTY